MNWAALITELEAVMQQAPSIIAEVEAFWNLIKGTVTTPPAAEHVDRMTASIAAARKGP